MIIYNVTVKVDTEIAPEWVEWMKTVHIPALMATGLFTESKLCRLLEQDELEGVTYAAQYSCDSIEHYNTYIDKYSQDMRQQSFEKFGNRFIAFRTVMEVEA